MKTLTRILLIGAAAGLVSVPNLQAQSIYSQGHADIGVGYEGGELEPHWHIEGGIVDGSSVNAEFEPDEILALVPDSTALARPAGSQWDFLGVAAGETFWSLPSDGLDAAELNAPFLGLATEELSASDFAGVTISLTGFSGPGEFALFLSDSNISMATYDGLSAADAITLPAGLHIHRNWAFSAPGSYDLEFTVTPDWIGAGPAPSAVTSTFSFFVVPEPGSGSLLLAGAAGWAMLHRRRRASRGERR